MQPGRSRASTGVASEGQAKVFPWVYPFGGTERRKRFRGKMALYQKNYASGCWTEAETARHVEPLLAFVRRAESEAFRRRVLESTECDFRCGATHGVAGG